MLGEAFPAAADGRTSSVLAEARIETRRPRRRVARLELLLVVRPHGGMPSPPPLAACSCRFRSCLATWADAGARGRQSPPPADDTRRCTTARRFGLPPLSARWKRPLLETRECSRCDEGKSCASKSKERSKEILGFGAGQLLRDEAPCGIPPVDAEIPARLSEQYRRGYTEKARR